APGPHYEHLVNEGPPLNVDAELAAAEQEEAEGEPKAALRFALTDLGNGERLVARYRGRLLWCVARGWLAWDGRRWAPDRTGQVDKLAQETVRAIPEEAQGLEGEAWAALMKHAGRSEAAPRIKAMIELARPRLAILPELLDADPMVLNVANGTLDLRTGSLRPHDPADLLTKLAPVDFDPAATCPIWESFLRRVLAGDEDLIRFTQRALGYSLVGDTIEHALFLLYGTGCNGKSVFISTVCAIMGDYALTASFDSFLARRPGDSGPRDDLARLAGARMVAASEPPAGATWDEATLKALTGQDRIAARHLYHDSFEFTPAFKLWLSTNHKPRTRDSSLAFWRRIRLIPFVVTIPEQERDPRLADKLKAEAPGILAWMVRGCLDWQRRGLGQAEAVVKATGGYQTDEDAAQRFMDERCDVDPEAWTAARELWTAWQAWSAAAGEEPRSQKWLANRLVEKGLTSERVTRERQRGWRGVALLAADGSAPRTDRGRLFPETSPTSLMGGFSGGMCPQPSAPPYPSAPAPPPHDGQTIGAPAPLAALSGKHCLDGEAELVARDPSAPGGNGHGNLPEPPEWVVHLHDPIPPEEAEEWLAP
ncbi:MAG: hypothetical protein FJ125_15265, partial [Deltaproteobacteria bacterium]|nr:hypothetical protein [Deltaproteobacteria bacterium]